MRGMGKETPHRRLSAEIAAAAPAPPTGALADPVVIVTTTGATLDAIAMLCDIIHRHELEVRGTPERWALFSKDGLYRYALVTDINPAGKGANAFGGLNPSDATHEVNDNSHTKCLEFTRRWGFRYNWMVNVFAIRNKVRQVVKSVADPVGPANNEILAFVAKHVDQFVAAWGVDAKHLARGARVKRDLLAAGANLRVFRFNDDGSPEHPLYMPYEQPTQAWS